MSDPIRIRTAGLADAAAIAEFNLLLARETENRPLEPSTVRAGVEAVLSDPRKGVYFVALAPDAGSEPIGQCSVTYEWSDWRNGDFWWLQSVYVVAAWRRRGVFRALFEAVRRAAGEAKAAGLRLYVEGENHTAQETYRRQGFRPTSYQVFELEFERIPAPGANP